MVLSPQPNGGVDVAIDETLTDSDIAKILVVDDNDKNILALDGILARPGIEILTAQSGADALRLLLKHDFAVILLDVLMPTMDGFETASLIRTREASKHTPIIFLTAAGSDVNMVDRGYAVGAVDYLIKPLNPDIVMAKVAVFVDLFRKTRRIKRQEESLRVAERERGEAALKESDALYEASFNAAAVGIAHTAADGRWLRINPRFCEIIGYSREEAIGLRFQDITHPDDLPDQVAGLKHLIAGEIATYHREKRYLHKNGHTVWVDLTVSLLRDAAGRPKHFIKVVEDITERRRADERQRLLSGASQILLRSLDQRTTLEDVAQLAVTSFCDWCIIGTISLGEEPTCDLSIAHADPALNASVADLRQRLLGVPNLRDILARNAPETVPDLSNVIAESWKIDRSSWEVLQRLGCGPAILVPLTVREQLLGQNVLVSTNPSRRFGSRDLETALDLAQRVSLGVENARLYHQAQEAVRARDEFLSIASHELRTPLTPLQIHFQRLLRKHGDDIALAPQHLRRILERCERQVRRLEALIDNLLDVSRISAGRLRLQTETIDLTEIAGEVASRFAEELAAAGCDLRMHSVGAVTGRWDRLRLDQVVTNVLGNAIKYGAGKPIDITVEETSSGGRLSIQDYGIGINGQDVDRIFRRFQRAVSSRSYGGLGLGLYITRQIVDAHCGTIRVDSKPGVGSVFVVDTSPCPAGICSF
ncbi:MAG: PAS domain S-box protein [Deltaproteobacteria bacterium]|nr:PAS domain S-box protein [Deltaproteobacteria bacterium]